VLSPSRAPASSSNSATLGGTPRKPTGLKHLISPASRTLPAALGSPAASKRALTSMTVVDDVTLELEERGGTTSGLTSPAPTHPDAENPTSSLTHRFVFDRVCDAAATQVSRVGRRDCAQGVVNLFPPLQGCVFAHVGAPAVAAVMRGLNASILLYGRTGTWGASDL